MKIEKLTLHHFRGASGKCEVSFDPTKSLMVIFGENGTGKSTIVDAIDFIANSTQGSLEDRSVGSQGHAYLPSIMKKASDLKIELSSKESHWTGTLSSKSVQVSGGPGKLSVRVLRRARLLRLVEAQPADRYRALQEFIDVTNVETAEQSLRDVIRATKSDWEKAVAILTDATSALDILWKQEGSESENAESWAKQKSEIDPSKLKEEVDSLDAIIKSLEAVISKRAELDEAKDSLDNLDKEKQNISAEVGKLPLISGTQTIALVQLLQQVQNIIAEPNAPSTCPVCEQPVIPANLRESISGRLLKMTEHQTWAKKQAQNEGKLKTARTTWDKATNTYIETMRIAASKIKGNEPASVSTDSVHWHEHEVFLQNKDLDESQLTAAKALQEKFITIQPSYHQALLTARKDLNQYTAIKGYFDRIVSNRDQANRHKTLNERLEQALKVCESTRRDFTQSVLDDVEGEVNRLYSAIHPQEPLGPLRLTINPKKKGSIEQDATFAGKKGVPPQAYFSESHLDTLGFCVWLALAKRDNSRETVIVLDDIFTSIDSAHLSRIMDLLAEMVRDFEQVIITTHFRAWRDRFRFSLGPGLMAQLLELHHWTLDRGVCYSGTKLAVQDIESLLMAQPLDRQAVASQSGILLEAVLDRLTLLYRRRVPRSHDGEWTLNDLLSSCKKLFDVLGVEKTSLDGSDNLSSSQSSVKIAIQPFFQDTGPLSFIRNQVGCHFNLSGSEVADSDVKAFGEATVALAKALICPNCGEMPGRKAGTHFYCICKQTKMTPLEYDK